MSRAEPRGTMAWRPIAILHARIGTMLADFLALHPQVTVQLEATNRRVDVVGEVWTWRSACDRRRWRTVTLVVRVLARRVWCTGQPGAVAASGRAAGAGRSGDDADRRSGIAQPAACLGIHRAGRCWPACTIARGWSAMT